jgi:hypothetical protein
MAEEHTELSLPTPRPRRPDEYHVYVRHADVTYFLAEDGTFVPELERAKAFIDIEDAHAVVNRMAEGRELGRDEPGIVRNARRWIGGWSGGSE